MNQSINTPFANIADFVSLSTVLEDCHNGCRIVGSDTPFNEETGELVGFSEVGEWNCPDDAAEYFAQDIFANVTDMDVQEGMTQETNADSETIEENMGEWTSMANEVEMSLKAEYEGRNNLWHKLARDVGQNPHRQMEYLADWRKHRFFNLVRYIARCDDSAKLIRLKDKCWARYKLSLASCIAQVKALGPDASDKDKSACWSGQYLTKYDILEITRLVMARVREL